VVDIPLNGSTGEFTYRLVWPDGGIQWLGNEGGNGTVSFYLSTSSERPTSVRVARYDLGEDEVKTFVLPAPEWAISAGTVLERKHHSWVSPRRITSIADISDQLRSQFVTLRSATGDRIQAYLPLSSTACSSVLRRIDGDLCLEAHRDLPSGKVEGLVVVGEGPEWDVHGVVGEMIAEARKIVSEADDMPVRASAPAPQRRGLGSVRKWPRLGRAHVSTAFAPGTPSATSTPPRRSPTPFPPSARRTRH
jgi:hypothetical protein